MSRDWAGTNPGYAMDNTDTPKPPPNGPAQEIGETEMAKKDSQRFDEIANELSDILAGVSKEILAADRTAWSFRLLADATEEATGGLRALGNVLKLKEN